MDTKTLLSHIELELQRQVSRLDAPRTKDFHEMLAYHMGWTGEGAGPEATGKRIRPILVLLTTASCGASWQLALPAAAGIELVHNFSLVHDDIQDNSPKRRGRDTIWVKWGAPMAINVGDALFVMSSQAIMDLKNNFPADVVVRAAEILHNTCLDLTRGQTATTDGLQAEVAKAHIGTAGRQAGVAAFLFLAEFSSSWLQHVSLLISCRACPPRPPLAARRGSAHRPCTPTP